MKRVCTLFLVIASFGVVSVCGAPVAFSGDALPVPNIYDGVGDNVLAIEKPVSGEPAIVTITHQGSANFAVWALDADLQQLDLLVNTIGNYGGTVALDFETDETTALEISADGAWHIEVKPALSARRFKKHVLVQGIGDDVLIYRGKRAGIGAVSNTGDANFAMWFYGRLTDLLVNEIGNYSGNVRFTRGPAFVVVESNGSWSVQVD